MSFFSKIPFVSTVFAVLCRFRFFYTAVRILKLIFRTKMCLTIFCQLQFFVFLKASFDLFFPILCSFGYQILWFFIKKILWLGVGSVLTKSSLLKYHKFKFFWHQFVISLTGLLAEWNTVITTGQILYWNNLWLRHQQVWSVEVLPAGRGQY